MKTLIITSSTLIILSSTVFANWLGDLNIANTSAKSSSASSNNITEHTQLVSSSNQLSTNSDSVTVKRNSGNTYNTVKPAQSVNDKVSNFDSNSNSFAPLGFDPSVSPLPQMTSKQPKLKSQKSASQKQDLNKLRTMWEAQRKQAVAMLKRIDDAEKASNQRAK